MVERTWERGAIELDREGLASSSVELDAAAEQAGDLDAISTYVSVELVPLPQHACR